MNNRLFLRQVFLVLSLMLLSCCYAAPLLSRSELNSSEVTSSKETKTETSSTEEFNNALVSVEQSVAQGDLFSAQQQLIKAFNLAKNDFQRAQSYLLTSQIYFLQGSLLKAKKLLEQVIQLKEPLLTDQANIQIASILKIQQHDEQAELIYQQLSDNANVEVSAIAKINLSQMINREQENSQEKILLLAAYEKIKSINGASQLALLIFFIQQTIDRYPDLAWQALQKLSRYPQLKKQPRYYSQLFAYRSYLYAHQGKIEDALALVQRAIYIAQPYPDLLMQWEWQQGRILSGIDKNRAMQAYRRAESHLQKIRSSIPVRYIDGRSSYREMLAPLYMEYTQLLFTLAKTAKRNKKLIKEQHLLADAQRVIESLKVAELRDYFKNACAIEQYPLIDLTLKSPKTAFIYPIIFENNLDILLGLNNQLYHYSIKVKQRQLHRVIRRAMLRMRPTVNGKLRPFGKREISQLYHWLIKPLEKQLKQADIDTLVFVPDGILRMLPAAALWDGKQYLIEKYALATMPGASLLDPAPLSRASIEGDNILIAGLSKPGNVVKELPLPMQLSLVEPNASIAGQQRMLQMRSLPMPFLATKATTRALNQRGIVFDNLTQTQQPLVLRQYQIDKIKTSLALPGVETEINLLEKITNSKAILNSDFQLDAFRQKIKAASIVHIASHGMFTGEPESSFIMTYDHLLDMNVLADLFKTGAYTDQPVDLLVLSACQTAEGDDRSPLGLAGVALQSGARSILGSLWPISDSTASIVFPTFYQTLKDDNSLSKAKALQQAQIKLIHTKNRSHPFYWAPFVLIGNWL